MAIPAFHFSGVYRNKLLSGSKRASVMTGKQKYSGEVLVYLSDTPNLFDPKAVETRIGSAKIIACHTSPLKELTEAEAKNCGYESSLELITEMKKWFPNLKNQDDVTYVEFDLKVNK